MTPFVLLFIYLFVVWLFSANIQNIEKRSVRQCLFSFVGLIIVLGLHSPNQGIDVENAYIPLFYYVDGKFSFDQYLGYEPMFYNYVSLIKRFTNQEQVFLFITATLTVVPILCFFEKESKNPIFSIIFYVSWVLFHFSFSGIRQAMAVSIVSIAYIYMFQRKYVVFIIIVIGAALIHTSALLAILALPLFCIKLKDTKWFAIFILFAIITLEIPSVLVTIIDFIFSDSGRYQNDLENIRGDGFTLALVYLFFAFVVSFLKRKDKERSYVQFILLLFVVQLLGMRSDVATRIGYYFLPLLYVIYPNVIEQSKHPKMYALLSCFMFISFFFYAYSGGYLNVLPLKMCWE